LQLEFAERKLAEQMALAAEEKNRLILEAAGDGIWGVDLEGRTTFVNPAAARMVGYDVEELIGEPLHGIVHHSLPDGGPCARDDCPLDAGLRDGEVHEADDEFLWRSDGTTFPVKFTSTPIRKDAELFGAVLTFNDITEQLRVDRMKNEFISTVSHELRTPLTSVYGSLGLIRGGAVGELPIASGRIDFEWVRLDIAQLVQRSIEANKAYADRYDVTLLLVESPPEKEIYGDADRLMQVMTNLLSNAAKFSRKNSRVEISLYDLGPQVRISVKDQGAGIPEDFRDRLFDRFTQVDQLSRSMAERSPVTA
jgi:PAS domain S-box-containing protein